MSKATSPRVTVPLSLILILNLTLSAFAGISFVPGQGVVLTGADGVVLTGADGVVLTGADGVVLTGADGVVLTGADGVVLTGADGVVLTGADGVVLTGADAITYTRPYGVVLTGADSKGIRSIDVELAFLLKDLPNTSAINVFIAFHQMPTREDFDALSAVGILGGMRFRNLPIVMVNATASQIERISTLPSVRSIYSNKTLEFFTHDTRVVTGQDRVVSDSVLTRRNAGIPLSGKGLTVAVLDTGIDATHPDLPFGTKVVQNARVFDLTSFLTVFAYPQAIEGLLNSDPVMGHGTFVASVIAGTGAASGSYYGGMAPGARLLGVSAGDASLFYVLAGMDYILSNRVEQNIRVVNCSFGISGVFDANDPVNIATRIMHDAGISVVFSAGNRGDQPNSLNPYSVPDWVIGVGSGTKGGGLSDFSSRGQMGYAMFHPTLVAPGEDVVAARAFGVNVLGLSGLATVTSEASRQVPTAYLPSYAVSSGTSFAAPHVAGTIALMLQANPALTPDQIRNILQETATPMLGYTRYEVGAGYLNTYAAVRKAAFSTTPFGDFRAALIDPNVRYARDPMVRFDGEVAPGETYTTTFDMPYDATSSTVEVSWLRAMLAPNDLSITVENAGEAFRSKPSVMLGGTRVQKAGVALDEPAPGQWTISVRNLSNPLTGSVQKFTGAIETVRATYPNLSSVSDLPQPDLEAIKRALRKGLVTANSGGNSFAGDSPSTRLELARAVMLGAGARVPQYLPYSPTFSDVLPDANSVFVESTVHSPRGNLMGDTGSQFNPAGHAERLVAAIAMVKAAGLADEARAASTTNPGLSDWESIPLAARGYVAVALAKGLMGARSGGYFRPFDALTRAELAVAAVALLEKAR
jgi:serine protease AprX